MKNKLSSLETSRSRFGWHFKVLLLLPSLSRTNLCIQFNYFIMQMCEYKKSINERRASEVMKESKWIEQKISMHGLSYSLAMLA